VLAFGCATLHVVSHDDWLSTKNATMIDAANKLTHQVACAYAGGQMGGQHLDIILSRLLVELAHKDTRP